MVNQVMIAVQARSTSVRFPDKSSAKIDNLTVIEHVLQACKGTVTFLNKESHKTGIKSFCTLLVPYGDKLKNIKNQLIVEGDEADVLSRYVKAVNEYMPDYIVRITGDCPLALPVLITRCIKAAVRDNKDYVSNVWNKLRTFEDGLDVEVISKKLLYWLDKNAMSSLDREHVTILFRQLMPTQFSIGTVLNHIDRSDIKLSVDLPEDLNRVKMYKKKLSDKIELATKLGHSVYRF